MNWTTPRIVLLVVATSLLTSLCNNYLFRRTLDSSTGFMPGPDMMVQRPGGMGRGQRGMTLRQYPPADSQALITLQDKVKSRQDAKDTTNEFTISLKKYINCKLTDPLADTPDQKDHTLSELPAGVHTYGGVPFDVQGVVQLNGPSVQTGAKLWPLEVPDIAVGHICKKLHLLHGAFNIVAPSANITFAKMVLHYADGSSAELELTGGVHALRCVDAQIPEEFELLQAPQTELAWMGSNAYLKKNNSSVLLHLYRTTLDNPRPETEVKSIDYLSTMVNPGPFMAGLTVE
jgi:hypothetical protein